MSAHSEEDVKSYRERAVEKYQRDERYREKNRIEDAIRRCGLALDAGTPHDYWFVASVCRDVLMPSLLDDPLPYYDEELSGEDGWSYVALHRFASQPDAWVDTVADAEPGPLARGEDSDARRVVEGAFESLECIAESSGVVSGELTPTAEAIGFNSTVGEHQSGYDVDLGDPVSLVDNSPDQYLKTLHTGGTNQGKSTGVDTEVYDRWMDGNVIIDILDLKNGENMLYDIPQQQDVLRRIREEMLGDPEFGDNPVPDMRVLVPMTPSLKDQHLPYDTESDEYEVVPFSVPASNLSEELLVALIMSQLTPTEETAVRNLYSQVDGGSDDWTLSDLCDAIRRSEEIQNEKEARVIGTLTALNQEGFIRDQSDPHTIDWGEIFSDPQTITAVSCHYMDSTASQLMAIGYLLHEVVDRCEGVDTTIVARELWRLAPHGKREATDRKAASLQDSIGDYIGEILREGRHMGVEMLCDTQHPSDLKLSVRELFNRYVVYDASKSTTQDLFDWTSGEEWESFYRTLSKQSGVCGVIGQTDPAVNRRGVEYISPVKLAPPPFHHFSTSTDGSRTHKGAAARAEYLDHVELRVPAEDGAEWYTDCDLPARLEIGDGGDVQHRTPMEEFVAGALEHTGERKHYAYTEDVRDAYRQFAESHDDAKPIQSKQAFGIRVKQAMLNEFDGVSDNDDIDVHPREDGQAYIEFVMKPKGEELRDEYRGAGG